jgi:hypothetical protein
MQFGHALQQILETILNANPCYGPIYLIKVDIADGFYCVWVNTSDIPKLGVIFPPLPNSEPLVAFPLVLPMGWTESPPYFCAATETFVDLANQQAERTHPPPHRLDSVADTAPAIEVRPPPGQHSDSLWESVSVPPHRRCPRPGLAQKPLGTFDIFVDDAIGLVQGGTLRQQ